MSNEQNASNINVSESNDSIDNQKLLKLSDFYPILISCIYIILSIIIFSFGILYILYKISPDYQLAFSFLLTINT